MSFKKYYLFVTAFVCANFIYAQEPQLTSSDSIVKSSWMFGIGTNIVDDSGDIFRNLFAVKDNWNMVPYPSRLSIGRYFKNGIGVEAIGSYNKYKVGKIIDGYPNTKETSYLAFDARLSYDLNNVFGQTGWFDPYVSLGAGYTKANDNSRTTFNGGFGFRTWFSDCFGLDFNSTGKWAVENLTKNHIQHSIGVVYQFDVEKDLSKKGLAKLELIEEMLAETKRVNDSISLEKRKAEDARLLAERVAKEKRDAELAKLEKERLDLENQKRMDLENQIKAIGYAYFDLNSFYINKGSKTKLNTLAEFLSTNPNVQLLLRSHTDSRGSDEYNLLLSDKRVKSSIAYLIKKGVQPLRLEGEGLGESELINKCSNGIICTEKEHSENRRSEFIIKSF